MTSGKLSIEVTGNSCCGIMRTVILYAEASVVLGSWSWSWNQFFFTVHVFLLYLTYYSGSMYQVAAKRNHVVKNCCSFSLEWIDPAYGWHDRSEFSTVVLVLQKWSCIHHVAEAQTKTYSHF